MKFHLPRLLYCFMFAFLLRFTKASKANPSSLSRGATDDLVYANFVPHEFHYLNITILGAASVDEGNECGFACVNTLPCFSFNLAAFPDINGRLLCELLPSDKYNNSDKFVASEIFHHYSIWSECSSGPCQNNGACVSAYEQNTYTCVCTAGYTGKDCETDVDECASSPCLNEGSCSDFVNGYSCTCQPGYIGSQCEIDVDECASTPCLNGGTCSDLVNGYNCSCQPGYNGSQCEIDVDECASSPCLNEGNCSDLVNDYNCTCQPGYIGSQCEIDVDECASTPCLNGGTCSDLVNGYNCSCQPGYNGSQCEIDIDECASNPCLHGGTCTDLVNDYRCGCYRDFGGKDCENAPHECRDGNYVNLTENNRRLTAANGSNCDDALNGWYRFSGDAGTKMLGVRPAGTVGCGTSYPGYLTESHPSPVHGTIIRRVCFEYSWCCANIKVRNCVGFFVYELKPVVNSCCNARYCSSD